MNGETQPVPFDDVTADRRIGKRLRPNSDAALRRDPQSLTIALVGITQATGVLAFDFAQETRSRMPCRGRTPRG